MEVTIAQAYPLIVKILQAGLTLNLVGSPGIGKTDLIHSIANEFKLFLIDFRLSQADPTDLNGFPGLDPKTQRSYYAPPSIFPLETDPIPDGFRGFIIFFDEFSHASLAVQAAAYKIVLDHMIGSHKLHPKAVIVCAGNKETDRAIVNRLSTAMQSRLVHINLMTDREAWMKWAEENGIDYRIRGFIPFRPELLHNFDPKHRDNTFASPRTWHFLSRLITGIPEITDDLLPLIAGTIGEGPAHEFLQFCRLYKELPTKVQIQGNPTGTPVPYEPGTLYAISSMLSTYLDDQNIGQIMVYIERMPVEFQVVTLRPALKRQKSLRKHPAISKWISEHHQELT